ncbi:hypothetical protein [Streptomyces sp. CB03911]|uniref:phage tail tube protein n=1 Tax=Streptomyces sp. CB03911 TaxID=1804758 RepID=UPI000939D18D|nr:hypothetical protein [Streptomyces sp. CB03911]OKI22203.1 hypothetical protein A6A07_34580 [Streptomyces sp. CB03911]
MDLISDGKTRVVWLPSISSLTAPTAAELNAAADFTQRITPDGLKKDPTTASVDTGSIASRTDTEEVGRVKWDIEVTFKIGTTPTDQLPYTTLTLGTHGFMVCRHDIDFETAFAAGQVVEVYPVACGQRARKAAAANEVSKFMSPMKLTAAASIDSVVA